MGNLIEILCYTPQLEKAVREKLDRMEYKWVGGESLLEKSVWHHYQNETCLCIDKDGITFGPITPHEHREPFSLYSAIDFLYHMVDLSKEYDTISGFRVKLSFIDDRTVYGWIMRSEYHFIPAQWFEWSGECSHKYPIIDSESYEEMGNLDLIERQK